MYNGLQLEIIRILIQSDGFICAQKIAEQVHVSRRTIFNNMNVVKQICEEYKAILISISSKGYKIENYYDLYVFVKENHKEYIQVGNEDYKMYITYLLLEDDEPIRISELQDILYCSRPTIYKYLDEIKNWFLKYEIELIVSRNGIYLEAGEKRYRHMLDWWILEAMELVKSNKKMGYIDNFMIEKSLKQFFPVAFDAVEVSVEEICDLLATHITPQELKNISVLLEIIMYRTKRNKNAKISERLVALTTNFFSYEKIHQVSELIKENLNYKLGENEIIYLINSLVQNGNFSDYQIINESAQNFVLSQSLLDEIEAYIVQCLNISKASIMELMEDIKFIIKREILFQIKGENSASAKYYNSILQNFHATVLMAQDIFKLIEKYCEIFYYEKTICNITFSLLSITQKSKQNLRATLIHDCDIFEFKYVLSYLQQFPFISLVYSTDVIADLKDFLNRNKPDIIFSMVDYKYEAIPVVEISKIFGKVEFQKIMNVSAFLMDLDDPFL